MLEHLEGPRLSTLIRRGRLAIEQVLPLGLDLVRLLRYLEAERVLHLDVKPRNIIMAGRPRLIDLSVARRAAASAARPPVGTEAYMAPEQCVGRRGFGELQPATDVWGVGATLFEALSGAPPFPPDGTPLPAAASRPRAPPASRARRRLAELVLDCLAPEPADRPSLPRSGTALERLVDELPRPA